jgi:hypothetical protein
MNKNKIYWPILAILGIAWSGMLVSCTPDEITIEYPQSGSMQFDVLHNGFFSTLDNGTEVVGTVSKTYQRVTFESQNGVQSLHNSYLMDGSQGYHKHSLPSELLQRIPYSITGKGYSVESVSDLNTYFATVKSLQIPEKYRRQLDNVEYLPKFKGLLTKQWQWLHLLEGKYPTKQNVTSLVKERRPQMPAGVTLDSVVIDRLSHIEGRDCIRYDIYYAEPIVFPYFLWEQWAYSTQEGKAYKNFRPVQESSFAKVQYTVYLGMDDGYVCREQENRREEYVIADKESGAQAEFTAIAYIERLYTPVKD